MKRQPHIFINILCIFSLFLLLPLIAHAHSGGLNSSGCHTNHKTGDYHCHGGGQSGGGAIGGASSGRSSGQSNAYSGGLDVISAQPQTSSSQGTVIVGVTDGDTVRVTIEGQEVKIRLYGIDAPESGQAFGKASHQTLKQITTGRKISIKVLDRDRYGRLVALVFADGSNVNEAMVVSGYAWVYPQYCTQSFCGEWNQHQARAQANHKGLWKEGNPIPPWDWRHNK